MEKEIQFLQYVIEHLVDNIDAIKIERKEDDMGILLLLEVDKNDIGKVIGKNGVIIQAVRSLLKIIGAKQGQRINLKIVE